MKYRVFARLALAGYACTLVVGGGCSGPTALAPTVTPQQTFVAQNRRHKLLQQYVNHIVIIIQENRSFDNIFDGFPGAATQTFGYEHDGTKVNLQPITFEDGDDMDHYFGTAVMDWDNGNMDKFDLNGTSGSGATIGARGYSYINRTEVAPYWTIAKQYVLADHMFPTMFGPSFTGHLSLIAGTADLTPTLSETNSPTVSPWGCDAPSGTVTATVNSNRVVNSHGGPFPCFTQFKTLGDSLDAAGVPWRYYTDKIGAGGGLWSSFDAIHSIRYSGYWTRVVSPPQQILADVPAGKLANVTWVIPDLQWSDHPAARKDYGPSWVASVVNAIGQSKFWKSSAIVVVWDDWGGFYDNVPPPQRDFRGLGIRVGCLIVSPYVKPHVSHTVYEFGSILKFAEQAFGLSPLGTQADGYTDGRANSIIDSFDFTMSPRTFKVIPAKYPPSFFAKHAPSLKPPDDE